jgi:hypothetical protein
MASVISSEACRATYSLTASLNNWLRDLEYIGGMEMAVFILLV